MHERQSITSIIADEPPPVMGLTGKAVTGRAPRLLEIACASRGSDGKHMFPACLSNMLTSSITSETGVQTVLLMFGVPMQGFWGT
jgi:hypothetical protein